MKFTTDEFEDLVVLFIFDCLVEVYAITDRKDGNKKFDILINDLEKKGLIPLFHKYFIGVDKSVKAKYYEFARIFNKGKYGAKILNVEGEKEENG